MGFVRRASMHLIFVRFLGFFRGNWWGCESTILRTFVDDVRIERFDRRGVRGCESVVGRTGGTVA